MFLRRFVFLAILLFAFFSSSLAQLTFTEVQTPTSNLIRKVHFTSEHVGWAYTAQGQILKSDDEGYSWEIVYSDTSSEFWTMNWADENHGWLGGPETFLRTQDGGDTWQNLPLINPGDEYDALFFTDSLTGYVGVFRTTPNIEIKVYKTFDAGDTWALTNFAIPGVIFFNFDFLDENNGWVCTGGDLAYTADGGNTWTQSFTGTPFNYNWIDITDMNHAWAVTDSGEVNWTTNATSWSYQGLSTTDDIYQVEMLNQSFGACVGDNDGFWIFEAGAWSQISGIANGLSLNGVFIENESKMWLCGEGGKIYRGEETPTDAVLYLNDIPDTICGSYEFDILATAANASDYPISELDIKVYVNGILQDYEQWTGTLNPSQDVQFSLGPIIVDSPSEIEVQIFGDSVTFNNLISHTPTYIPSTTAGVQSPVEGCSGDQIELNAWGGESYLWYQGNDDGSDLEAGDQITIEVGTMRQYHVLIIQDYCTFEDSILIDGSGCAEATAFSPNGDGVNDFFFIENLSANGNNVVTIYNRWGDAVNNFSNYDNENVAWRGTNFIGNSLPVGTYFYVVNFDNGAEPFSGWAQILR